MDNSKLNVRNIYIDLLEKMKALDAVDQAYIDHLISLVRQDIGLIDSEVTAIEALIPEGATAENKLATNADLPIYDGSGSHNNIYRGKNLGSQVTSDQWAAIQSGDFTDLFIGDYWEINSVKWRIAHFDYFMGIGNTAVTDHHIVIVPDSSLYNTTMNTSNSTVGGYYNSKMHGGENYLVSGESNLYTAKTTIDSAFGSTHILSHTELLTNAITDGVASGYSWYDTYVDLLSELMVLGTSIMSYAGKNYECGIDKNQLSLFRLNSNMIDNGSAWWVRNITSSANFGILYTTGPVSSAGAGSSNGVRPYFAIYNPTT